MSTLRRLLPYATLWFRSPGNIATVALACFVLTVSARTDADADLWGHLVFGRDIVAAGELPRTDAYSFTSDREWVNHEWLAETAMWAVWSASGTAGVVVFKLGLLIGSVATVWWSLRCLGVRDGPRAVLTLAAWLGMVPRAAHMRPQVFSVALFTALMAILVCCRLAGRRRLLYALPPMFIAWVNLHGGWIVGAGVLALWTGLTAAEPGRRRSEVAAAALLSALCVAATLVNPYGIGMWRFMAETVGFARDDIADWAPLHRYPAHWVPWLISSIAVLWVLLTRRPLADRHLLIVPAALAAATVRVNRLDVFSIVSAVLVAGACVSQRSSPQEAPTPSDRHHDWAFVAIGTLALALVITTTALTIRAEARCMRVNDVPALPEPEAAQFIERAPLTGRMLTFYDYGEYAIWHFAPRIRVSLDGRRETVYSDAVVQDHWAFFRDPDGHVGYPDAIGADHIWLPNYLHAGRALESNNWTRVFTGPKSSIWSRKPSTGHPRSSPPTAPRCFPGP